MWRQLDGSVGASTFRPSTLHSGFGYCRAAHRIPALTDAGNHRYKHRRSGDRMTTAPPALPVYRNELSSRTRETKSMVDFIGFNRPIIEEFRANNGTVPSLGGNAPMLLLHHVGRNSGKEFVAPLRYFLDGYGRRFIVASKGGMPEDPEWYHNALAAETVTIELGDHDEVVRAIPVTGLERDELYANLVVTQAPEFADYARKVDRVIPIIELLATNQYDMPAT
jgi:deazaflavin-dependent oxidoreductase (nitroreductase family)